MNTKITKNQIEEAVERIFRNPTKDTELTLEETSLLERAFGSLTIQNTDSVFIAMVNSDSVKLTTGIKGLINLYTKTSGLIKIYETVYNGKVLTSEEKTKFYEKLLKHA